MRDELRQRRGGDLAGMHNDDMGRTRDHGDRNKIALDAVAELGIDRRRYGVMRCADKEGIAVRRRLRRCRGADRAAAASAVFDQHPGAELLVQLYGERARERIGPAARGKRHDQHDRLLRPGLGKRRAGSNRKARQGGDHQGPCSFLIHFDFLRLFAIANCP